MQPRKCVCIICFRLFNTWLQHCMLDCVQSFFVENVLCSKLLSSCIESHRLDAQASFSEDTRWCIWWDKDANTAHARNISNMFIICCCTPMYAARWGQVSRSLSTSVMLIHYSLLVLPKIIILIWCTCTVFHPLWVTFYSPLKDVLILILTL